MANTHTHETHETAVQHPSHQLPTQAEIDAKKAEEKEKARASAASSWSGKIKGVIDTYHVPISSAGVAPITPVVGAVERSIWGNSVNDDAAAPAPEAMKARKEYNAKVAGLQDEITKLRVERGPEDPEYQEAQRLYNIAFR